VIVSADEEQVGRCHVCAKASQSMVRNVPPGTRTSVDVRYAAAAAKRGAAQCGPNRPKVAGADRAAGAAPVNWRDQPPAKKRDVETVAPSSLCFSFVRRFANRSVRNRVVRNYGAWVSWESGGWNSACHREDISAPRHHRVRSKRALPWQVPILISFCLRHGVILIKGVASEVSMDFSRRALMRSMKRAC